MSEITQENSSSGLSLQDLLYVAFRHKKKIIILALLGFAAAACSYLLAPPMYESEAKLLVRYVVDRSAVDPIESAAGANRFSETIINSEVEILRSWDLYEQVAEVVGPQKLLPEAKNAATKTAAAAVIGAGLTVTPVKATNVIGVSYKNRDPELATVVLSALVKCYYTRHIEIHRDSRALNSVGEQVDKIRGKLRETEDLLNKEKAKQHIISLAESTASINTELRTAQEDVRKGEIELAQQRAFVRSIGGAEADDTEQLFAAPAMQAPAPALPATPAAPAAPGSPAAPPAPASSSVSPAPAGAATAVSPTAVTGGPPKAQLNPPANGPAHSATPATKPSETAAAPRGGASKPASTPQTEAGDARPTQEDLEQYQAAVDGVAQLRKSLMELRLHYKSETVVVKGTEREIEELLNRRHELEKKFPDIGSRAPVAATTTVQSREPDLVTEKANLAKMVARMKILNARLTNVTARADQFAADAPKVAELERTQKLEENNYINAASSYENANREKDMDLGNPTKIPNISEVQSPTPAMRVVNSRNKLTMVLAGGGLGVGLLIAFMLEFVIDRTVKRPVELENRLQIPLLLSIPRMGRNGRGPRLALNGKHKVNGTNGHHHGSETNGKELASNGVANGESLTVAPWEPTHFIRPFSEAIRDRLGLYFEMTGLTRKPKLVAVTGLTEGAGTSTLAAGLAAALSETGEGKVLLVDMNFGQADVHPFFQGRPASSLSAALQASGPIASAADNLYLATAVRPSDTSSQFGLKRFHSLMPEFAASDFDYIIFDMPPLGQTSPTAAMVGMMDKVLLVIEAEKCDRDAIKRSHQELIASRANVSAVFNKSRSYAPKWVEGGN